MITLHVFIPERSSSRTWYLIFWWTLAMYRLCLHFKITISIAIGGKFSGAPVLEHHTWQCGVWCGHYLRSDMKAERLGRRSRYESIDQFLDFRGFNSCGYVFFSMIFPHDFCSLSFVHFLRFYWHKYTLFQFYLFIFLVLSYAKKNTS